MCGTHNYASLRSQTKRPRFGRWQISFHETPCFKGQRKLKEKQKARAKSLQKVLKCILISTNKSRDDVQAMNLAQAEARLRAAAGKRSVQDSVPALPDNMDDVVTTICATEPDAPVPPSNSLSSATVEGMNDEDEDDPGRPHLPPCIELISLSHFDDIKITALNGALKGNTRYRFAFTEGEVLAVPPLFLQESGHSGGIPVDSATAEGMNDEDEDDPGRPHLPPRIELISLGHFDDIKIAALNGALKGNTRYRFAFTEGGYRSYHGRRPKRGGRSAADNRTTMLDEETGFWVPIPANYTAPHTPEDLIEAENDIRIQDRRCIAYVHPETRKAFKELNASREPGDPEIHPLHVYDISEGEEAALVAGLEGEEAAYKFRKPWEEGHSRYQGSLPQEGAQNAADRRTEMWDNETQH
ncbi:uncharacterized protein LACBIDRAFT_331423 [Laccaria bicolor S238N-H82]|uniref:Predicted protein n=1 Tax=Laccaria bicolor (strain S238N-H82 / ATCC MYA-4686) TaxID=486041 RepID=B0DPF3_LACBS|nr:uncharacterized protein LACBIDRAFT_331423 [Laccaria bicolor S238N-H82]EDR03675.1 predicted protein [Laccaria bicolor S238N-H82]|eukprot:XP_001885823.1 predicted protein [Laccaria bicolor S238N-H82]